MDEVGVLVPLYSVVDRTLDTITMIHRSSLLETKILVADVVEGLGVHSLKCSLDTEGQASLKGEVRAPDLRIDEVLTYHIDLRGAW